MPSLRNALSHSSSSNSHHSSDSSSVFYSPANYYGGGSARHIFDDGQQLMWKQKLRHATEDELRLRSGDIDGRSKSNSLPVSPDFGSRKTDHWSKSALSQLLFHFRFVDIDIDDFQRESNVKRGDLLGIQNLRKLQDRNRDLWSHLRIIERQKHENYRFSRKMVDF